MPTRMMKSLVAQRLSGTHGHCILVKPNVPVPIPDVVYAQALACGMQEVSTEAPSEEKEVDPIPQTGDNTEAEEALFAEALDKALMVILTRGDESDLKASDSTPKLQRVIAEMPPEVRKPTATEVAEAYERLQESIDLAE